MYDTEALFNEADALTVARYLGMEIVQKGTRYYIPCPGHFNRLGKPDRKIGNCVLTTKGYHCFACGQRVGMVNMVIEYTGCDYKKALETIGDACGGSNLFEIGDTPQVKKQPLSPEDLKLIGLVPYGNNTTMVPVNASDVREENITAEQVMAKHGSEYILYERQEGISLDKLYRTNPQAYNRLIAKKAKAAIVMYKNAISAFCTRGSSQADVVFDVLNEDGYVNGEWLCSLQNVFQARLWRAEEIYNEWNSR